MRTTIFFICILCSSAVFMMGCQQDEESPAAPPPVVTNQYGLGSLSFTTSDSVRFAAIGQYKPSAQFAADTLGEGVGGFAHDTTIGGRPLVGRIMAYTHSLMRGMLNERVLVVSMYNVAGSVSTGSYAIVRPDSAATGNYVLAAFLSFSDSLGEYSVYESRSGSLIVSSWNFSSRHAVGAFSGLFRGLPPDTLNVIQITSGSFDVNLAGSYFNY